MNVDEGMMDEVDVSVLIDWELKSSRNYVGAEVVREQRQIRRRCPLGLFVHLFS